MLFGMVGLLVALAIVGLLAMKQLRATGQVAAQALPALPGAARTASEAVREQSRQLQQRVKSDVDQALQQGAASRGDEAAK
jgi:hypothetical protein